MVQIFGTVLEQPLLIYRCYEPSIDSSDLALLSVLNHSLGILH